jgi:general secretion pathway protein J
MSKRGRSKRSKRADAGFTLVEALVSLLVFSVIAAGSAALLIQASRAQARVAEAHEALRALQMTRATLNADLSHMAPRNPRAADGGLGPRFLGGDATVALGFVRAAAVRASEGGVTNALAFVQYSIEGDRLIRRASPVLETPLAAGPDDQMLLSGARNLRFEFYDGSVWRQQWISGGGAGLPRAVALAGETPRYGDVRIEILTMQEAR